jgi:hypothetical protein
MCAAIGKSQIPLTLGSHDENRFGEPLAGKIDCTSFFREFRYLANLHSHLAILKAPQVGTQWLCFANP